MKKISPHALLTGILIITALIISYASFISTHTAVIGKTIIIEQELLSIKDGSKSKIITSISNASNSDNPYPITALSLLEEPDVLETYTQYNQFLEDQANIANIFNQGTDVTLHFNDSTEKTYALTTRSITELPLGFYIQIIAGIICIGIGGAIWAFNQDHWPSFIYFFMGVSVALSCFSSSIYTTRELFIDPDLFRRLSIINHIGAAGFGSGLAAIFFCYPLFIVKKWLVCLIALSFLPVVIMDSLQLTEQIATGFHMWMLVFIVIALTGASVQWYQTRNHALERAILKWLLLSIVATSMIFTAFNIIPSIFMTSSLGPQALTLSGFALGFMLMALGLSRYKLFNLDRWWYQYWLWFLAGIALVVLDLVLISFFHLSQIPALSLSLAIIGWLYFPVRQLLWNSLMPSASNSLNEILPQITQKLFSAKNQDELHNIWQQILQSTFTPLKLTPYQSDNFYGIVDDGQGLIVPSLSEKPFFYLQHAKQGRRLFSQQDKILAERMHELLNNANNGLNAREQGQNIERSRIQRDLHDDLGAHLLSLSHSSDLADSHQLARKSIQELRYILSALEQKPCPLQEALDIWQEEIRERSQKSSLELHWQEDLDANPTLNSRQRHNLSRALRELTSNALKYSNGNNINIQCTLQKQKLSIRFMDDGQQRRENPTGKGKNILQHRIEEIGGNVSWFVDEQQYRIDILLPLTN